MGLNITFTLVFQCYCGDLVSASLQCLHTCILFSMMLHQGARKPLLELNKNLLNHSRLKARNGSP